jgi:hypothetical protein
MSDELILELIAAIEAAIADGRGKLTPAHARRLEPQISRPLKARARLEQRELRVHRA